MKIKMPNYLGMEEQKDQKIKNKEEGDPNKEEELSVKKVPLGPRKLEFYFNLIKFPIIIAVILEVVYFLAQKNFDLVWIFDFPILGFVALMITKKHQGRYLELAIACGMTGLLIGFFSALFKLIYIRKFYLIFNLISEPAITAVIGVFMGLTIGYLFLNILNRDKIIKTKDSNSNPPAGEKKGGD